MVVHFKKEEKQLLDQVRLNRDTEPQIAPEACAIGVCDEQVAPCMVTSATYISVM